MDMTPVTSTTVAQVGYDENTASLHVIFTSGAAYTYHNVPEEAYEALLSAASIGAYLNREIKGAYDYSRD